MEKSPLFLYHPTVYVFDREYQILIPFDLPTLLWVKVGNHTYYDHFAGVMKSDCKVHRVCVPQEILDQAGAYTVCYRPIP